MDKIIAQFPNQIKEAIQIGQQVKLNANAEIKNILACGLGGSGIGGAISKLIFNSDLLVPFASTNDYHIPGFVNENTLVIATSYSGNTEETLSALEKCIQKNATVVVITSGGKLLELAKSNNWPCFVVPGGEQPRAMLAYSLVQQMFILKGFGLIKTDIETELLQTIELVNTAESDIKVEAKALAEKTFGLTPVIYSDPTFEGVAIRFRQQINENSKVLCWHAVIPEMNHNELVGWAGADRKIAVIKLNSDFEYYRTAKRWEFCKQTIANITPNIFEINAKGKSVIAQALYLIHLTDWVSYYLAELKQIDPNEVDVIINLKSKLSELK